MTSLLQLFARLHKAGPEYLRPDSDPDLQVREAHNLAGAAGIVGLIPLGERARNLEGLLAGTSPTSPTESDRERALGEVRALLERTVAAIDEVFAL